MRSLWPTALCVPVLVHRAGRILHWNDAAQLAARRLGHDATPNGLAQGIWTALHPDEHDGVLQSYARITETGRPLQGVQRHLRDTEGRTYRVLASGWPTVWQGDDAVLTTFVFLDPLPGSPAAQQWHRMRELTPAARDVAMLAAQGCTEDFIAEVVNLPMQVVREHLGEAQRQLGAGSSLELMLLLAG